MYRYLLLSVFACVMLPFVLFAQLETTDLTWSEFKQVFNAANDKPLIVTVLGVNCSACRSHRDDDLYQVMNQCDNPDLQWFVIWFENPGNPAVRADAESQALLVSDSRVTQWWFNEHKPSTSKNDSIAYYLGESSWNGCFYAWDISLLYDTGNIWIAGEPPAPDYCMAKVSSCCNAYNITNFKNEVDNLNACKADTSTGVTERQNGWLEISVIPDYARHYIVLNFSEPVTNGSVRLFDVTGRKLHSQRFYGTTQSLNIKFAGTTSRKGIYLIEILVENQRYVKKFQWN